MTVHLIRPSGAVDDAKLRGLVAVRRSAAASEIQAGPSVGTRMGWKTTVTAISGADVVEKRSNLVSLMRALFDAVIDWGEKLVYTGTKDEALPPRATGARDGSAIGYLTAAAATCH